jgi:hypothetical protein
MEGAMKVTIVIVAALLVAPAFAKDTYVKPHVRKDGTYVEGHYRSAPNNNQYDNYSSQGNHNPYTGQQGTVNPYPTPQPQKHCYKDAYGNTTCY